MTTPSAMLVYSRSLVPRPPAFLPLLTSLAWEGSGNETSTVAYCLKMVLCIVIGCSNRSCHAKDVPFYRIPKIITYWSPRDYELTKKGRDGFLAAIVRDDLTGKVSANVASWPFLWAPAVHLVLCFSPYPLRLQLLCNRVEKDLARLDRFLCPLQECSQVNQIAGQSACG